MNSEDNRIDLGAYDAWRIFLAVTETPHVKALWNQLPGMGHTLGLKKQDIDSRVSNELSCTVFEDGLDLDQQRVMNRLRQDTIAQTIKDFAIHRAAFESRMQVWDVRMHGATGQLLMERFTHEERSTFKADAEALLMAAWKIIIFIQPEQVTSATSLAHAKDAIPKISRGFDTGHAYAAEHAFKALNAGIKAIRANPVRDTPFLRLDPKSIDTGTVAPLAAWKGARKEWGEGTITIDAFTQPPAVNATPRNKGREDGVVVLFPGNTTRLKTEEL